MIGNYQLQHLTVSLLYLKTFGNIWQILNSLSRRGMDLEAKGNTTHYFGKKNKKKKKKDRKHSSDSFGNMFSSYLLNF